ncbi:aflatoxin B1 aldehyde reductase member 2 [Dothidotthia symphoricarpi CBS 119687]|uniref:Aflatoxin B1 aldehyde reductase member 2 n=1 Tax=Dothidotthia symphoricarpi CBS 119687 TaxID=1392245 RepID=A0A6A6AMG7_9PLEO|nr:aflatoxin B1 aldehyde reductase member 2 [Dothidotthia symphoricarpi CBS 119687]KAF2132363.1 aflatoxin B1 aldehyde reductase member 2 [Dothidotthia symphoricarpi CBS 119687]
MPLIAQNPKDRVILGLMTFGPDESSGARVTDFDEFTKHLDYFQSQGYDEIDTARMYVGGKQEAWTRDAKWQDRGLTLATKVFPYKAGVHKPDQLKEHFNTSLKELGAQTVDIFYLHAPDRSVPFEETLEAVNDLHKQGAFVQLGLSNYAAWEVAEIYNICKERKWVRPTIYQAMYNAITRAIETELVPCCRKYKIDIVVYNPLAGGLFSGKIKSADIAPDEGRFSNKAERVGSMYRDRYFKDSTFKALQLIEATAQKHDLTLLEIALRWCIHHSELKTRVKGGNDGVIIGVSRFEQLEGNLANLEKGPLPEEVVKTLDEAWMIAKASAPTYWR